MVNEIISTGFLICCAFVEWTLRSIFGSNVGQTCPLSSLTNVYVDLQLTQVDFVIQTNLNVYLCL